MRALPESQREVALLFYIKDYSQREIAAFLDLPLTTVNNRLHAARKALKERLAMMSKKIGRVTAVHGRVVDVRFDPDDMPLILSALVVSDEAGRQGETLQVVQRVGAGLVRCLIHDPAARVTSGTTVANTDGPMLTTIDAAATLTHVMPVLGRTDRKPERLELLETGIKVIDLLCPYARRGTAGIFGPSGTGRMVLCAEVLHNIVHGDASISLFAFVHSEREARGLYDTPEDVPTPAGAGQVIALPIDNSVDTSSPAVMAASALLDARTYLSANLGRSGIWPAVDPLLSTSRLMDPALIGQEYYEVARDVRALLRRYRELQEAAPDGQARPLSADDRTLIARARRMQRFFTQPFAVAEPFTGRAGQSVPLAETIRVCEALLSGAYDGVPEEAFLWRGTIES